MRLHDLLERSAQRAPNAPAVHGPDGVLTYGELDKLANRIARCLAELGVGRGDRVGVWLNRSTKTVAAMQGVLKLGAAYVPLDPQSPAARAQTILTDCAVSALVASEGRVASIEDAVAAVPLLLTDESPKEAKSWSDLEAYSDEAVDDPQTGDDDLAYILYTSGSTGVPKGVCISHRNALAFVEWAVDELEASPGDRFSNHAPFHFDLSVLDIYAAFWAGACVYLIPEALSYSGGKLLEFLREHEITVWYSVPTALMMMMDSDDAFGKDSDHLRAVLFAGEVFPIKHLRTLHAALPGVRLLNLYGPTETNVCTYYEVREIAPDQGKPVPIGKASCGDHVWAQKPDGSVAGVGEEGELWVEGPTVMLGYWGKEPQGDTPYATGDIVVLLPDGNYDYVGRRDHQVKVRGYRIELGEIEAALLDHASIQETAVVVAGQGSTARLIAFIVCSGKKPSILALKKQCAARVPNYMIIDSAEALSALPRTANGKIDRIKLKQMAE